MSIFDRVLAPFRQVEQKSAPAAASLATITTSAQLADFVEGRGGSPDLSLTGYGNNNVNFVYARNPVAHQCVNLIAQQLSNVDLIIVKGEEEVENPNDPYVRLMRRPNLTTSGTRFFHDIAAHLLLFGNAYLVRSKANAGDAYGLLKRGKGELRLLNPIHMTVVDSGKLFPDQYRYQSGSDIRVFPVDPITGACELLHLKTFNPNNQYVGLPAAASAYLAVLNHNAGQMWNYNNLANNAVPAAVLTLKDGAGLTAEQAAQIRNDFDRLYRGGANAGKTAVLGEMELTILGMDPAKMQYTAGQEASARNIALAFGVSPMLMGMPGDNTYANMEAATAGLYQQRVLPLLDYILEEITVWLAPVFPDARVTYDWDSVAALEVSRQSKWASVKDVNFISVNEKRAHLGYDEVAGGDVIPGVNQPTVEVVTQAEPDLNEHEPEAPAEGSDEPSNSK